MDVLQRAYDAYAARVAREIYLVVGDENLAGDAVNAAFARSGYARDALAADDAMESLIRAEALRLVTGPWGRIRKARIRKARMRKALPRHDPAENASGAERSGDVLLFRALQALPVHLRVALVLHHVAGLSPDEVAAESESTVGAAVARIERGENELARSAAPHGQDLHPGELDRRLAALAEHATVRLLMPQVAAKLPARRSRRTVLAVLFGAAGLVLLLVAASSFVGGGRAAQPESATAPAARPSAALAEPGLSAPPTPAPGTALPVLPTREAAPDLASAPDSGEDFGFAREAFVHADTTYLGLDRAQLRSGHISNVSTHLRTFAFAGGARVVAGPKLSEALGGQPIGLEQFLRLVAAGQVDEVAVTVRYDDSGRIEEISEYESG